MLALDDNKNRGSPDMAAGRDLLAASHMSVALASRALVPKPFPPLVLRPFRAPFGVLAVLYFGRISVDL
jgi:hypothetical protein